MEKTKAKTDRGTVIKIIQSVLCITYAAVMAVQAINIYTSGTAARAADPRAVIYSQEIAADAILKGLPVLVLAVTVTVVAACLGVKNRNKPYTDVEYTRDLMAARVKEPSAEMKAERSKQKKLLIGGWTGFALAMVPIVLYMTNANNFAQSDPKGLEAVLAAMVLFVVPWAAVGIGILSIAFILRDKSIRKETEYARKCEKGENGHEAPKSHGKAVIAVRCVVLVLAVTFIILGINNGSAKAVLSKAITICTECVGLG